MDKVSYVGNGDINAIEFLYNQYRKDPESVDEGWKKFFEGFEFAKSNYDEESVIPENFQKEFKVLNLINSYRTRGHLFTQTNPVRERRKYAPTLDLVNYGLEESDLSLTFQAGSELGLGATTLQKIVDHLKLSYCQSIGVEYMYIRNPEEIKWLQKQLNRNSNHPNYSVESKKYILQKLNHCNRLRPNCLRPNCLRPNRTYR